MLSENGGTSNSYDAAGNLTSNGGLTYSYDAANRLSGFLSETTTYGYDGDGMRVRRSDYGSTPVFYVWSSKLGQVALEATNSGIQRVYVYAGGKLIAQQSTDGQFYWVHTNHLGNGRALTDVNGNLVYRGEFDPYGQPLLEWSATGNNWLNSKKFTGYERDAATGLDYAKARMYVNGMARFMQPDPLGLKAAALTSPLSLNRYTYALNDPVNHFDPSGLLTIIISGTLSFGGWAERNQPFWNAVKATFGEDPVHYDWTSLLVATITGNSIIAAGKDLAQQLALYTFRPGEKLNIVAHSHGGNVAKFLTLFTQIKPIDVLVTLGTPQRPDFRINMSKVYNYFNVYTKYDAIQKLGGLFPGTGGRTDKCALNIGVDSAVSHWPKQSHEDLHTPRAWAEMLAWLSRARLSLFFRGANGSLNRDGGCGRGAWGTVGGLPTSSDDDGTSGEGGGNGPILN